MLCIWLHDDPSVDLTGAAGVFAVADEPRDIVLTPELPQAVHFVKENRILGMLVAVRVILFPQGGVKTRMCRNI